MASCIQEWSHQTHGDPMWCHPLTCLHGSNADINEAVEHVIRVSIAKPKDFDPKLSRLGTYILFEFYAPMKLQELFINRQHRAGHIELSKARDKKCSKMALIGARGSSLSRLRGSSNRRNDFICMNRWRDMVAWQTAQPSRDDHSSSTSRWLDRKAPVTHRDNILLSNTSSQNWGKKFQSILCVTNED